MATKSRRKGSLHLALSFCRSSAAASEKSTSISAISATTCTASALKPTALSPNTSVERMTPTIVKTMGPEILKRLKSLEKYPYPRITRVIPRIIKCSCIGSAFTIIRCYLKLPPSARCRFTRLRRRFFMTCILCISAEIHWL